MSPEIVIENVVGKAVRRVTLPDAVGSSCQIGDVSARVIAPGSVRVLSGLIHGAQEVLSRKLVDGKGVEVGFAGEQGRVDLRRVDSVGEVSFVSVVARPSR